MTLVAFLYWQHLSGPFLRHLSFWPLWEVGGGCTWTLVVYCVTMDRGPSRYLDTVLAVHESFEHNCHNPFYFFIEVWVILMYFLIQ